MFVAKDISIPMLWAFAKGNLIRTFFISIGAVVLYEILGWKFVAIPFVPIATIGTAVAFYMGFKNNQAYDRLWEARRLWGGISNTSRNLAVMLIAIVDDKEFVKDFLKRHVGYVNVLRLQLRRNIPWATSKLNIHQKPIGHHKEIEEFEAGLHNILEKHDKLQYYEVLKNKNNTASYFLKIQIDFLTKLKREKKIDDFEHSDLVKLINELFNLQGGCERIKTTPLFRQYSIFSRVFVSIFIILLPFGMLKDLSGLVEWGVWLTIPFSLLISWVFFTMEQIGEYSENPFDNAINDTPMSTICRNIEIDIKEFLGMELPPKLEPEHHILL
ncbi:MAG: bestrophin family ion channel [Bacteroidota bacterium]|nr:bestrophin family ion channel [Bacteroidota bacterium]